MKADVTLHPPHTKKKEERKKKAFTHFYTHCTDFSCIAFLCALGCNICFLSQGEQSHLQGNKLEKKIWAVTMPQILSLLNFSPFCLLHLFFFFFNLQYKVQKQTLRAQFIVGLSAVASR